MESEPEPENTNIVQLALSWQEGDMEALEDVV